MRHLDDASARRHSGHTRPGPARIHHRVRAAAPRGPGSCGQRALTPVRGASGRSGSDGLGVAPGPSFGCARRRASNGVARATAGVCGGAARAAIASGGRTGGAGPRRCFGGCGIGGCGGLGPPRRRASTRRTALAGSSRDHRARPAVTERVVVGGHPAQGCDDADRDVKGGRDGGRADPPGRAEGQRRGQPVRERGTGAARARAQGRRFRLEPMGRPGRLTSNSIPLEFIQQKYVTATQCVECERNALLHGGSSGVGVYATFEAAWS